MRSFFKYFGGSTIFALMALSTAFWIGYAQSGSLSAGLSMLFTAFMLGILETSLSFDNAVVNARIIETMTPFWRKMFLTIGMIIAVFGMRILFPLILVWIVSALPFGAVLEMTWKNPTHFQQILIDQHVLIAGFGGSFLWMVFAKFFFDTEKDVHWFRIVEKFLAKLGRMTSIWVLVTFLLTLIAYEIMPELHRADFLLAAVLGVITFLLVDGIGQLLHNPKLAQAAGLGAFIYLEFLDASFSFDGVIGAFAITNNLYIIALGLGIGAFFVRSITIKLVDQKTLGAFRYLEHGAFWAIGALALLMYLGGIGVEIPEVVSGSIGLVLIGLSFISSMIHNKKQTK